MRVYSKTLFILLLIIATLSFSQCASTYKLDKVAPTKFKDVYFQKWNAGIQEGGSGINVFIKTEDKSVTPDSVYFRGKGTRLIVYPNNLVLHIGRFTALNTSSIPFNLKEDECIVSYLKNKKVHYYKISNIREHTIVNYPSTPSKDN